MPEITKKITLDLSKVPRDQRARVKQEVGDFIKEEVLLRVADGKSPLKGSPRWKSLNPDYAKEEKGGDRTPNLELSGDMLDRFQVKNRRGSDIEIGIFSESKKINGRADGHNNFSGESKLPLRRFIPTQSEEYNRDIMRGVNEIIRENEATETNRPRPRVSDATASELTTSATIENLLSETTITSIIDEILNGQG